LKDGYIKLILFKVYGCDCKSNERLGVVIEVLSFFNESHMFVFVTCNSLER